MTPFHLLVLAIAVYRATRLLGVDEITAGMREFVRARTVRTLQRHDIAGEVIETKVETRPGHPMSRFAFAMLGCPWCLSMWLAGAAIASFLEAPTYTLDVAYVLASSVVAGILSERI